MWIEAQLRRDPRPYPIAEGTHRNSHAQSPPRRSDPPDALMRSASKQPEGPDPQPKAHPKPERKKTLNTRSGPALARLLRTRLKGSRRSRRKLPLGLRSTQFGTQPCNLRHRGAPHARCLGGLGGRVRVQHLVVRRRLLNGHGLASPSAQFRSILLDLALPASDPSVPALTSGLFSKLLEMLSRLSSSKRHRRPHLFEVPPGGQDPFGPRQRSSGCLAI